jgi:hypothetical protein
MLDVLLVAGILLLDNRSKLEILRVVQDVDKTLSTGQTNVNKTILGALVNAKT